MDYKGRIIGPPAVIVITYDMVTMGDMVMDVIGDDGCDW
jgi:hypothetical protein